MAKIRIHKSTTIVGIMTLLLLACLSCSRLQSQTVPTEILWDNYGVPHIYAKNASEMYYALGWAQIQNHTDLIVKLYAQARGKSAEYLGDEYLESDKLIQLFEIPEKANRFYLSQTKDYQAYLDAFVNGVNGYLKANPEVLSEPLRQVLPIKTSDAVSHILRTIFLEFIAKEDIYLSNNSIGAGSNAYAISPSRSASKNAMLVINPHLPWSDYFVWFESHLNAKDYNFYGISLVGMPALVMGFNNYLGWAKTINPIDACDRYELTLNGEGYMLDGKTIPFTKKSCTLQVKQKDGSLKKQQFEFLYSKHGPIVSRNNKKAYAIRIAGIDNTGIIEQYSKMTMAKNFTEFESAVKYLQIPMFNLIYSDKEGNIFYLFNGNVPFRNEGDFKFWKGTIDGTQSKYIWTQTHGYNDLPKLLNPTSGFIQNCNDAPWSCTYPFVLKSENYPAYMSSQSFLLRPQHAINMVKDNISISFDQLVDYKNNTEMEAADRFLDDLLKAVDHYPDSLSKVAAGILKKWDKKTDTNSQGAILFAAWWDKINSNMFKVPWNPKEPVSTPDGLKDEKQVVKLLSQAASEVIKKYGKIDISWGEVNRFRIDEIDYPANGGPGDHYGLFRTIYFTDTPDNRKSAVAGETFIAVVEFGEKVKAKVSLSYGNATQKGNRHKGDQLKDLSEKILRDALLEKDEVLKHLEKREVLSIEL